MAYPGVNQKAIAEHMQVSIATVSKALRGQPDISIATREKVARVAHELGYPGLFTAETQSRI